MAMYRCGGGGNASLITKNITANGTYDAQDDNADGYSSVNVSVSTPSPTLITKNITANGTYNAQDDNADGYSSVVVNVSGGGGCTINTQAQWDALSLQQKIAQGLTVIRDNAYQAIGVWRDMSNAVVDIIKEFFNSATENISMQVYAQQTLAHLIYFQGKWKKGSSWDSTVISHSDITYSSVDTGNITVNYTGFNNKLITILHGVTCGNNASITIRNGYGGVTDGGGVVAIPFNSTAELIGEHFGLSDENFVTSKKYDYVLFMSNKWHYGSDTSNGVYTINGGTLLQTGEERLVYSGSSSFVTAVYKDVPMGTTITLGSGLSNTEDSVIAIGINEIVI